MKLSVKTLRKMKAQLENVAYHGDISLPMRYDIRLTTDGVVVIPRFGYMHAQTFRDIAGEEAYQWLLSQPRVPSPYPENSKENK